jgi:light-regulated signal transduction histidine kinase (bacteriophytochrome)
MGRRAAVVIAIGAVVTGALFAFTATLDYSDFDPKGTLPKLAALAGLAITIIALVLVLWGARDQQKALAQAEQMTSQIQEREHDLLQSNRELERFATIAAHDLQEPLRTILTYTDLIERKYGGEMDGQALGYLLRVAAAAQRMRTLIEDLLVFARIGQAERQFEIVDLNEVVQAALANLETLITESEGVIEVGDLPTVRGNEPGLTQLFTNLIANALKYRLANGIRVDIAAQIRAGEWVISVADNGKGIDPVHHEKIFELFRRLETRDGAAGTGLGLAICARVVDVHGGRIWVKSTVGQGATFFFTLPLQSERKRGKGRDTGRLSTAEARAALDEAR